MAPQKFTKEAIADEEFVDHIRTMTYLHRLHAKGAVLNKRNWWIKWKTLPEVRAKWLQEIEEALVKAHVSHVWAEWPNRDVLRSRFEGLTKLVEVAEMPNTPTKLAAIEAVVADVMYPPRRDLCSAYSEGKHYDDDSDETTQAIQEWEALVEEEDTQANGCSEHKRDGTGREDDEHDEQKSGDDDCEYEEEPVEVSSLGLDIQNMVAQYKKTYSIGQIAWYVAMTMAREKLRGLEPVDWTREQITRHLRRIWSAKNQEVIVRTCTLISAVLREGPCTLDVLALYLPGEQRLNVLRLLQYHFTKICVMLENATATIESQLKTIAKHLRLTEAAEDESVHVPGPAPKTWLSDNCIPADLKSKFVAEITKLEDVKAEAKDWHPKSNNQVLNLVHPSLYCGVADQTKLLAAGEEENLYSDPAAHMRAIMFATTRRVLEPSHHDGFQWLPCEMDVAENGEARVRTYINNLHPEDHGALYGSIGDIFSRFVPLFDQVLSTLVNPRAHPAYSQSPRWSIAGSRCQVIVKIAEIVLTPEKPSYDGGSWHVEGTMAENIIATGLYYFGCENITESRLSFCTLVTSPDYEQSDDVGVALSYGFHDHQTLVQNLGGVTAMEDRCVVFPNILHHKVEPFRLADPTKPGVRKILAFFLVNPTKDPIVSTAVVPPQQEEWAHRAQEPALKKLRLPDVVSHQIRDMASDRMSREDAQEIRLDLMYERSADNLYDREEETYVFSLCEH